MYHLVNLDTNMLLLQFCTSLAINTFDRSNMYKLKRTTEDKDKTEDRKLQAVLSILREKDTKISHVPLIASHVALYELQTSPQQPSKHAWHKTEIEGSLFVVERSDNKPKLRIIIRNNQATDEGDFEQDIDAKVELETKDNTVFYKVGNSVVRGLWFHHSDSLDKFSDILKNFQPPAPRQDAGKALLAALGVGASATAAAVASVGPGGSVSAPVAPVAAPTKISAPPGLTKTANIKPQTAPIVIPRAAVVEEPEADTDAASLLREALGRGSIRSAAMPMVTPSTPPTFPVPTSDRIWVSKADLRMVLGEMVLSDNFVNELFARLSKRQ
jgi:hypothetical protein